MFGVWGQGAGKPRKSVAPHQLKHSLSVPNKDLLDPKP